MSENEEVLVCSICERNIKENKMFPIYSSKFNIICSECCILGALYSEGDIDDKTLEPIPEEIRNKIVKIYAEEDT